MGLKVIIIDKELSLKHNDKKHTYGELLLNFIYKDYSPVINFINSTYKKLLNESGFLNKTQNSNQTSEIFDKLKIHPLSSEELKEIESLKKYNFEDKTRNSNSPEEITNMLITHSALKNKELLYSNLEKFFNTVIYQNSFFDDKNYQDDIFFKIFIYEFFILYNKLNKVDLNFEEIFKGINKILYKITNLQDLYYEAVNICFNISHKSLKKYSIDDRIYYYEHFAYSVNALKHFYKSTHIFEIHIRESELDNINTNLYNSEKDYQDEDIDLYPPSTDVMSRKDSAKFDSKINKIIHTYPKNYFLDSETLKIFNKHYKSEAYIKVIEFNSLLSLCNFLFFKLLDHKNEFTIQECDLCSKLFYKRPKSSKQYCDNIFQNNKKCSDKNIGAKITHTINISKKEITKIQGRIYKKLWKRETNDASESKEALADFKKLSTAFKRDNISDAEYALVLNYFDKLKQREYKRENLPADIKMLFEKIKND